MSTCAVAPIISQGPLIFNHTEGHEVVMEKIFPTATVNPTNNLPNDFSSTTM